MVASIHREIDQYLVSKAEQQQDIPGERELLKSSAAFMLRWSCYAIPLWMI